MRGGGGIGTRGALALITLVAALSAPAVAQASTALNGISCVSSSFCVAVDSAGTAHFSSNADLAAATWNSTNIDGTATLYGVSCPTSGLCVGADWSGNVLYSTNANAATPTWTSTYTGNAYSALNAIACPTGTTNLCVAVDSNGDVVTSQAPTGGTSAWQVTKVDTARLTGVSCASASLCVAVDVSGNAVVSTTPAVGSSWSKIDIDGTTELSAISCPSASLCVATDWGGNVVWSTAPTTSSWSRAHIDTHSNLLQSIACPSSTLCVAVDQGGYVADSSNPTGGASTWASGPLQTAGKLNSVSCVASALCAAVDGSGNYWPVMWSGDLSTGNFSQYGVMQQCVDSNSIVGNTAQGVSLTAGSAPSTSPDGNTNASLFTETDDALPEDPLANPPSNYDCFANGTASYLVQGVSDTGDIIHVNADPSAAVLSPYVLKAGTSEYVRLSIYLPATINLPQTGVSVNSLYFACSAAAQSAPWYGCSSTGPHAGMGPVGSQFAQVLELFGKPYGNPAVGLDLSSDGHGHDVLDLGQYIDTNPGQYAFPWCSSALSPGTWNTVVLHVGLGDPGSVQLWENGVQQSFVPGNQVVGSGCQTGGTTTTLSYDTLQSSSQTQQQVYIDQYRSLLSFGPYGYAENSPIDYDVADVQAAAYPFFR